MRNSFILSMSLSTSVAVMLATCSQKAAESPASPAAQDWSNLRDFTAIDATGPDNVAVTIGPDFAVRAEGDAKAVAEIDMRVRDGKLVIGRKSQGNWTFGNKGEGKDVTIRVTMPAIRAAALTGAGDFELDRAQGDMLDLALTGAGDFRIGTVTLKTLSADITGAGSITIAGTVDRADLSVTGAGDIEAQALKAGSAKVSMLGAGDIGFASDGQVAISIMGPGDVTVKGKAQCKTSGTGPGEARCAP